MIFLSAVKDYNSVVFSLAKEAILSIILDKYGFALVMMC